MWGVTLTSIICLASSGCQLAIASPSSDNSTVSEQRLYIHISHLEARGTAFFFQPFAPSTRTKNQSLWLTESVISPGTYLTLETHTDAVFDGILTGISAPERSIQLGSNRPSVKIEIDEISTLTIRSRAKPILGSLIGSLVGGSTGLMLAHHSTQEQSTSKIVLVSFSIGLVIGLSIGLLHGIDSTFYIEPDRRRLSLNADPNSLN